MKHTRTTDRALSRRGWRRQSASSAEADSLYKIPSSSGFHAQRHIRRLHAEQRENCVFYRPLTPYSTATCRCLLTFIHTTRYGLSRLFQTLRFMNSSGLLHLHVCLHSISLLFALLCGHHVALSRLQSALHPPEAAQHANVVRLLVLVVVRTWGGPP